MPLNSRHLRPRHRSKLDPQLRQAWTWGDPTAVVEHLGGPGTVLCHIDGGETAFELALSGAHVIAVGSESARALLGLKCAATRLPFVEALQLMGRLEPGRRIHIYHQLRGDLPPTVRRYWDSFEGTLRLGLMDHGGLERKLARLRGPLQRLWPAGQHLGEVEERELVQGLRRSLRWRLVDRLQPWPGFRVHVEDMLERGVAGSSGALAWLLTGHLVDLQGLEWSWLDPQRYTELGEAVQRIEIREETAEALLPGHDRVHLGTWRPDTDWTGRTVTGFGPPLAGARSLPARGLRGPLLLRTPAA